jgi:hypothetical protein
MLSINIYEHEISSALSSKFCSNVDQLFSLWITLYMLMGLRGLAASNGEIDVRIFDVPPRGSTIVLIPNRFLF